MLALSDTTQLVSDLLAPPAQVPAAGSSALDAVIRSVARCAYELTLADSALIELVEEDEVTYAAATGVAASSLGARLPLAASMSISASETGEVLLCGDSESDAWVDRAACRRLAVRSLIAVPIRQGAEVVGVLRVQSVRVAAFNEMHLSAMRSLAGIVADAMRREILPDVTPIEGTHCRVTALPTRRYLNQVIEERLQKEREFALLYLDFGDLAQWSEKGSGFRDWLLSRIADRLRSVTRLSDVVARVGEHEVAILADGVSSRPDAERIADKLATSLQVAFEHAGHRIELEVRHAVVLAPYDASNIDEMLEVAASRME